LFNIRAFSSDSTSLPFLKPTSTSEPQPEINPHEHEHDHSGDHESDHPQNPHYNDITTVLIPLPTLSANQQEKVESFLQTLLWESRIPNPNPGHANRESKTQGLDILRTKGYFETEDGSEFVIQGVTDIFEIKVVAEHQRRSRSGEEEKVDGKMVFIGRGVGEELRTAFERYVGL
jgi:G3E family GTPase